MNILPLKIYFAGAIRAGRQDAPIYNQLVGHLKQYGEVLTAHVGSLKLSDKGESADLGFIHQRDINWIKSCDCLVAEISTHSTGVGYEIGRALENDKKILCLFQSEKKPSVSGIVRGCKEIDVGEYSSIKEAKKFIDEFMKSL